MKIFGGKGGDGYTSVGGLKRGQERRFGEEQSQNVSTCIFELFERIRVRNNVYDDEILKSQVITFFLEHPDYFKVRFDFHILVIVNWELLEFGKLGKAK